MEFLSLKTEAFGLDVSELSLKIIKLKKRGGFFEPASFGEARIDPGLIKKGEVADEDSLAAVIKKALAGVKGEKLGTRRVVASLPEEKAFLQVIQMPKMPKERIKKAVFFEAENYIPMPIGEVYLDSQIIPAPEGGLDHFDVLIAGVPKKTVNSYVSCFKKAGLVVEALEVESQAVSRALVKGGFSPSPLLLVDIGATRTSLIIFSGHSLRFTSSVAFSSESLTAAIARSLKVTREKAEELKIRHGVAGGRSGTAKKISGATAPLLAEFAGQIGKYLNYYQTHSGHEHLPSDSEGAAVKVVLCGGGANFKGLADFLSSELLLAVELGNPWVNILPAPLKKVPRISFKKSLGYATALGLALRGVS